MCGCLDNSSLLNGFNRSLINVQTWEYNFHRVLPYLGPVDIMPSLVDSILNSLNNADLLCTEKIKSNSRLKSFWYNFLEKRCVQFNIISLVLSIGDFKQKLHSDTNTQWMLMYGLLANGLFFPFCFNYFYINKIMLTMLQSIFSKYIFKHFYHN